MILVGNKFFIRAYRSGRLNDPKEFDRAVMLTRRTLLKKLTPTGKAQHFPIQMAPNSHLATELVFRTKNQTSLLHMAYEMEKELDVRRLQVQAQYEVICELEDELKRKTEYMSTKMMKVE